MRLRLLRIRPFRIRRVPRRRRLRRRRNRLTGMIVLRVQCACARLRLRRMCSAMRSIIGRDVTYLILRVSILRRRTTVRARLPALTRHRALRSSVRRVRSVGSSGGGGGWWWVMRVCGGCGGIGVVGVHVVR